MTVLLSKRAVSLLLTIDIFLQSTMAIPMGQIMAKARDRAPDPVLAPDREATQTEKVWMRTNSAPSLGSRSANQLSHELARSNLREMRRPEPGTFDNSFSVEHLPKAALKKKALLGTEIVRIPEGAVSVAQRLRPDDEFERSIILQFYAKKRGPATLFHPEKPSTENIGAMWVKVPDENPGRRSAEMKNVQIFRIPAELERFLADKPSAKVFIREEKIDGQVVKTDFRVIYSDTVAVYKKPSSSTRSRAETI